MSKPNLTKEELTEIEIKIINVLGKGRLQTISLRDLCLRTNTKERQVRLAIENLRHEGYLIIFCPGKPMGYCIAETFDEVQSFMEYMRSRIINECWILRDIKVAAGKKFNKTFGQLPLMPL